MIKDTTVENDVINKIINIINIEKGLSKNSKKCLCFRYYFDE